MMTYFVTALVLYSVDGLDYRKLPQTRVDAQEEVVMERREREETAKERGSTF